MQKNGNANIEYEIIDEKGPDHEKVFTAEVKLDNKVLAIGKGKSKKLAEMQAAQKALENLKWGEFYEKICNTSNPTIW